MHTPNHTHIPMSPYTSTHIHAYTHTQRHICFDNNRIDIDVFEVFGVSGLDVPKLQTTHYIIFSKDR